MATRTAGRRKPLPKVLSQPLAISQEGLQLVLSVWSRDEFFSDVRMKALAARDGQPLENTQAAEIRDGVAVIPIYGPLFRHANMMMEISGGSSYGHLRKDLQAALDNPAVKAIVLDVDSPGGEVDGVAELSDAIRAATSAVKPVVAYVGGMGASAAYWLASAAQMIVCSETAMLGSIGVRTAVVDDSERDAKEGVRSIEIISSQSPGKRDLPVDDEVLGKVQAHADYLAEIFINAVAKNRGKSPEVVASDFGQGDVLIGERAVAAGLADRVGNLEQVIELFARSTEPGAAQAGPPVAKAAGLGPLQAAGPTQGVKNMPKAISKVRAEAEGAPKDPPGAEGDEDQMEGDAEAGTKCLHCEGSGKQSDGSECEVCSGSGKVGEALGAGADDGDHDEDDEGKPNEAGAEADADLDAAADAALDADDEEKQEKAALSALAKKHGLPPTASRREILMAANAGSIPAARVAALVDAKVNERFAAERRERAKKETAERAEKLAARAVRGGWTGDIKDLAAFARTNFSAAERMVADFLKKESALYSRVTGEAVAEERASSGDDVRVRQIGTTKVVKHAVSISSEAKAIAKKDGISFEAAMDRVVRERPELYQSYLETAWR